MGYLQFGALRPAPYRFVCGYSAFVISRWRSADAMDGQDGLNGVLVMPACDSLFGRLEVDCECSGVAAKIEKPYASPISAHTKVPLQTVSLFIFLACELP